MPTLTKNNLAQKFLFNKTNVTYDYTGLWDGSNHTGADTFSVKHALGTNFESEFEAAISYWNFATGFKITKNTTGTADISAYQAKLYTDALGKAGYFTDATTPIQGVGTGYDYTRSEIAFNYNSVDFQNNTEKRKFVMLHEIGHALGLKDITVSGVNTDMSVMINVHPTGSMGERYAITPMAYDIAILEDIYNSTGGTTSSTTYSSDWFSGTNRSFTIQNQSGQASFDLFAVSGDHYINLNKSLDKTQQTDSSGNPLYIVVDSNGDPILGNDGDWQTTTSVTAKAAYDYNWLGGTNRTIVNGQEYAYIAHNTTIKNGYGGSGDDTITGNEIGNKLEGNGGVDKIYGGEGADTIKGGADNDWLYGNTQYNFTDTASNSIEGGAGEDHLYGTSFGGDILDGGADNDTIVSKGNSILKGGSGVDYYSADAGDVIIDSDGGRVNNIEAVYGHTGEHVWQPGGFWRPFSVVGSDLKVYTGLASSDADSYYTIKNFLFQNDGRWGFSIAQKWLDGKNPYVISTTNEDTPTNDIYAEGNPDGTSATPPSGHVDENPSSSNPTVKALASNQHEHGYTNSVNYFRASIGYDTQSGGAQNDIYEWGSGFHNDRATETGGNDRIILTNLNAADVVAERIGDDVRIRALSSNETFTIKGHYLASANEIETLEFADGTTLNLAVAANGMSDVNETVYGTNADETLGGNAGDDYLYGKGGNDLLEGGLDDDTLEGDSGNDTYIWRAGDGNDVIIEVGSYIGGTDTLKLTGGITLADLDIYGSTSQDVYITHLPTGETLRIQDQFAGSRKIETLLFDDSSTFDLTVGVEWRGTAGDDTLYGGTGTDTMLGYAGDDYLYASPGNDTLDGGLDDDTMEGSSGDDTYIWRAGDGNDVIIEVGSYIGGNDTLKLTGGITLADLDIYGSTSQDVYITHLPTGETLRIQDQFASFRKIETLLFDDSSTFDLTVGVEWRGTAGDDTLYGGTGTDTMLGYAGDDYLYASPENDTLDGGVGDDTLEGSSGDDSYIWRAGDGNDVIKDIGSYIGGNDTLKLTGGITFADLDMYGIAGKHLQIEYVPTGETLTIWQHFKSSGRMIETIEFDDASIYDLAQTINPGGLSFIGSTGNDYLTATAGDDTLFGDAGNDYLYGYAGDDTLNGGTGVDYLYGYTGDDTYVWASGDGNDVFVEQNYSASANDVLHLTGGLVAADVSFSQSGYDLLITVASTSEVLTVDNQYYVDTDYHIETLLFDNGSTVDLLGV
ncbi:calcium-binding protein [Aquimarina macrocephali]|uniref:calcium-binding protein n=1 Tax=Aquimarina macrocephali TaxID=666563 RepID=UPI0004638211|nr:calcium-binding protein [Aquimarina macrocephali]